MDPRTIRSSYENENRRYWLNQPRRSSRRWGLAPLWAPLAEPGFVPEDGAEIVLGFDGSYTRDCTAPYHGAATGSVMTRSQAFLQLKMSKGEASPSGAGFERPVGDAMNDRRVGRVLRFALIAQGGSHCGNSDLAVTANQIGLFL